MSRSSGRRRSWAVLAGAWILAAGCGAPPREEPATCQIEGPQSTAALAGPVTQGAVFLDLSHSMAGFIGDASTPMPVTPLQMLLRTWLREGMGGVGVTQLEWYGFGRGIGPLPGALAAYTPQRGAGVRELFAQPETNLIGVLGAAAKRPDSVTVIVSDNAQDLLSPDGPVALGFDRGAVVRAVTDSLAGEGFGVWLVGALSAFRGSYFSVQLTSTPEGVAVNRAIALDGRQPLYLWVVSRDLDQGRSLVSFLLDQLEKPGVPAAGGSPEVHALELAPGIAPSVSLEAPSADDLARRASPGDRASWGGQFLETREWQFLGGRSRSKGVAAFGVARSSELLFLLKLRLGFERDAGRTAGLALPLWEIGVTTVLPLRAVVAEDLASPAEAVRDGYRFRVLRIPYEALAARREADWRLEVPISIFAQLDRVGDQHWLQRWSTRDDTRRQSIQGRTLFLEDVVRQILATTAARPRMAACLELQVKRD